MLWRFLRHLVVLTMAGALAACGSSSDAEQGPIVLAAASMQGALEDIADDWAAQGHARPVLSFSATPALARQVEQGAPADIVITADAQWMDWLEERGFLRAATRRDVIGNRLAMVGRDEASFAPGQRLAVADPDSVPAGRYGKAALIALGRWEDVQPALIPAENVRAALALVERGEADIGLVYASDAKASARVETIALVPEEMHPPIRYPVAVLKFSDNPDSAGFAAHITSAQAQAIFVRHGFTPLR